MAVKTLSLVWDSYPGGGSELLALLALADWSDDDGRCWPSIAAIARKTRLSRSQTQRTVHQLIAGGFVAVTGNETGGAPGSTRQYQITLAKLTGCTDATPTGRMDATGRADATGRTHALDGSHPCTKTGSAHATQTVSEPLKNRHCVDAPPAPRQQSDRRTRLPEGWRLPADWQQWAMQKMGWPPTKCEAVAEQFADHWRGKGERRVDWGATWRNWCRREPGFAAKTQGFKTTAEMHAETIRAMTTLTSQPATAERVIDAEVERLL